MKKDQGYTYADVYVSLLAYLNELSENIAQKHNVKKLTVINLEGFTDLAKLPEGDLIFISDWTMEVDGSRYGDIHDLMIGFSVVNDPNLMRLETMYMNELMLELSRRRPCRTNIPIMDNSTNTQKGLFVFNDSYETTNTRVEKSRTFKAAIIQLLSPQRLQADNSGT